MNIIRAKTVSGRVVTVNRDKVAYTTDGMEDGLPYTLVRFNEDSFIRLLITQEEFWK